MGRIKTMLIKRVTLELVQRHRSVLGTDFQHNKEVIGRVARTNSNKIRNIIAGYATRLMRKSK